MENKVSKAEKYRDRAQRIRVVAESFRDDSDRQYLSEIAHDYEKRATEAERLDERPARAAGKRGLHFKRQPGHAMNLFRHS